MEGERKSVFDRLGPIPGSNLGNDENSTNLRHVVDLKRRQNANNSTSEQQTKKFKSDTETLVCDKKTEPDNKIVIKDANKSEVADQSSDEGEIIDDDIDLIEQKNQGLDDKAMLSNKSNNDSVSASTKQNDIENSEAKKEEDDIDGDMSPISFEGNISEEESSKNKAQEEKNKNIENETKEAEEIIEESNDDTSLNDKVVLEENGSDYSDWSDGEDELLQGDNNKKDIDDSSSMDVSFNESKKKDIDLEAISDDDLDPINDDLCKTNNVDELLKTEGLSQLDGISTKHDIGLGMKLLDILEIDWKSLINTTSAVKTEGSKSSNDGEDSRTTFRKRNSAIALLNRVGFSEELAGSKLSTSIIEKLQSELDREYQPMLHKFPALHTFYREKREKRLNFFSDSKLSGYKDKMFRKMIEQ